MNNYNNNIKNKLLKKGKKKLILRNYKALFKILRTPLDF